MLPHIALHLLGTWELRVDGQAAPRPPTQKAQSLLAYLVLHADLAHQREKLATLFWPDSDDDRAQRSLRTALWSIRRLLEGAHPLLADALVASRSDVRWAPHIPVEVDVAQFEQAINRGPPRPDENPEAAAEILRAAAVLYRGPLLDGFYDEWCIHERFRLEEAFLTLLETLIAALEAAGHAREAIAAAQRLLAIDPLREDVHRVIIRLLTALGDRSGALRQYQRCKDVLADDLGVAPSPATEAAHAAVRAAPQLPDGPAAERRSAPPAIPGPDGAAGGPEAPAHTPALLPTHTQSLPLIGREPQWQALISWLALAEEGKGHAILLAGEAGSGKSRLLDEVAARARWQGMRVLQGRCYEYERVLPYQPFADALRSGLSRSSPTPPASAAAAGSIADHTLAALDVDAVAALPAIWQQALLLLLPEWSDRLQPPSVTLLTRPGDEQGQLLEGIAGLLSALAARQPLLLIVDDLHWAAASTLQLFHHLARRTRGQPILLLGGYRPEDLVATSETVSPLLGMQRSLLAEGALDMLALEPLALDDVARLTGYVLARHEPSHERDRAPEQEARSVAMILHRYTQGNPLYLLATLQTLQEAHALRRETAAGDETYCWTIDPHALHVAVEGQPVPGLDAEGVQGVPLPVPARIRDLLLERLARAGPAAREVARLAAVAGSEFDLRILERVWGRAEGDALDAVEELLSARFLREGSASQSRDFAFVHQLLRESIYAGLPRPARVRTHRKVAEAMEAVYGHRAVPAELAFHYAAGDDPRAALPHACAAAGLAAARYANEEAVSHYTHALALLEQVRAATGEEQAHALLAERFDLLAGRRAVLQRIGKPLEEAEDIRQLLLTAEALGNPAARVRALLERSTLEQRTGRIGEAERSAREAIAGALVLVHAGVGAAQALLAHAHACLGRAYQRQGIYPEALASYEQALACYRSAGQSAAAPDTGTSASPRGEADALDHLGQLREQTGEYAAARTHYEQALALYRAGGDLAGEAIACGHLGNVSWFSGDLADARTRWEQALALMRRIGDRGGEGRYLRNLGLILWQSGEPEQALAYHRQALRRFESAQAIDLMVECYHGIGDVQYVTGQTGAALESYERALELARSAGLRQSVAQSLYGCARAERTQGHPSAALARIAEARALYVAIGSPRGLAWCDREAGCAELARRHAAEAHGLLRAAVDEFARLGEPAFVAATRAELAHASLALGEREAALALAEAAGSILRVPSHGVDQPQAILFALYRCRKALGDSAGAQEALDRAMAEVAAQEARLHAPDLRASFIHDVPVNRAIAAAARAADAVARTGG